MADQRIRWTYEGTDRVVEGSPDKFRELCATVGDHGHGKPVLVEGDAGESEGATSPPDDGEPAPTLCGAELNSGGHCTREVGEPGAHCWQHEG